MRTPEPARGSPDGDDDMMDAAPREHG